MRAMHAAHDKAVAMAAVCGSRLGIALNITEDPPVFAVKEGLWLRGVRSRPG